MKLCRALLPGVTRAPLFKVADALGIVSFVLQSVCFLATLLFALTFHLLGVLRVVAATCLPLAFKSLVEVRVFCLYSVAPNFKAAALLYRIPA